MEAVIVAVVTVLGGIILEFLRRGASKREAAQLQTQKQIDRLQEKIDQLIDEVDEWKEKYYQLLKEISENSKH